MRLDVRDRIYRVVSVQLGVEHAELAPEASIVDDLCADSLDVFELVVALEEEFGIEVPDGDVDAIETLGDVERYVVDRLKELRL